MNLSDIPGRGAWLPEDILLYLQQQEDRVDWLKGLVDAIIYSLSNAGDGGVRAAGWPDAESPS